ncbi:TonB-dependent receptor plug domain-containing protein [Opitutus terrae]|nr:TonB-dependent receptor [Opitutus terrae]
MTTKVPPPNSGVRCLLASMLTLSLTSLGFAQQTPPPPATAAQPGDDDVIVLSPFEVDASKDKGYYAENTLAGSRMNTNIADLGASISVITKQQIEDTASVDINDVFRYEINTEGSSTYTPAQQSMRSDGVIDVNAGVTPGNNGIASTNATANRIRGLGTPSTAINFYPSISAVPMDAYNIDSLEINRGPNSMLFGMGSPAGIVNLNYARAVLNRDFARVQLRFDDRESYRASLSFNQVLWKDKLAVHGALLYDDRQFERKPSYDITRRQYATLTFKPLAKTTIRASVEGYSNDSRRPNSLTPRDFVTEWKNAGSPIYDSVTKQVTVNGTARGLYWPAGQSASAFATQVTNDTRAAIEASPGYNPALWNAARTQYAGVNINSEAALNNTGGIVNGAAQNVLFVPGITWVNQARTIQRISNGSLVDWFQPLGNQQYLTAWGTATNPAANPATYPTKANIWANPTWADIHNRYFTGSTGTSALYTKPLVGGYKYPGVTDKSIYDWENINLLQMNYAEQKNATYNVEIEQEITDDLFLNLGWFRQDFEAMSHYPVSQLNVATLFVDTNARLPNGSPNPYVGQVYLEDIDPDRFRDAEEDDHYRAMLAYTPDFRQKDGWLKWLGHHQLLGLWSKQDTTTSKIRQRLHYVAAGNEAGKFRWLRNSNNDASGNPTGWNRQTTSYRHMYYLSNPGDPAGAVTTSSGQWDHTTYTGGIQVYDYATSAFTSIPMTAEYIDFDATTGANQRELESLSAGMTNYLWNDRLITTFGVRRDDYRARTTTTGTIKNPDGSVTPALTNQQKWINGIHQTDLVLHRFGPWDELSGNTTTKGAVLKPFKNWHSIESRANSGSQFWQFVRDFGISYNESDNFNPPPSAQVDAFGNPLPKPTGEGRDIGFQFSMLDNKLFARVTWFEATNQNERFSPGSSISRLTGNVDTTLFRNWARTISMINMGMDPRLDGFGQNLSTQQEEQVKAAAEKIWQLPYDYYSNVGNIYATGNREAKGVEMVVNYNPVPNWTIKLTGGKQNTVNSDVLKEFDAWYAVRAPIWQAAKASTYLLPQYQNLASYTNAGGREVDLTNFLTSYGFESAVRLDDQFGNTNVQNYYNVNVQPQYALARDLNGQSAPNQRKYRGALLTSYSFDNDRFRGWFVGGSQRWEDRSVIGYYGKSSGANATPGYLDLSDISRPIYDSANWYTDVWVGYQRKIMNGKVGMKLQLNVYDIFESGGLQVTQVNYDGSPYAFRIKDPRQFVLTATFDF